VCKSSLIAANAYSYVEFQNLWVIGFKMAYFFSIACNEVLVLKHRMVRNHHQCLQRALNSKSRGLYISKKLCPIHVGFKGGLVFRHTMVANIFDCYHTHRLHGISRALVTGFKRALCDSIGFKKVLGLVT
jgi:hypothetical protein